MVFGSGVIYIITSVLCYIIYWFKSNVTSSLSTQNILLS